MNKYQLFPEIKNWNGITLSKNNILYCDDCQSPENICKICGNCKCNGYSCKHQKQTNIIKKNLSKEYIGDGVYAEYEDYQVILTTENGIEVTNRIRLEAEVLDNLNQYIKKTIYARYSSYDRKSTE